MTTDPSLSSPTSWQSRLEALKSRSVPEDDPRVTECRRALAFWRVRRAVEAERAVLGDDGVSAVDDLLLGLVSAVPS